MDDRTRNYLAGRFGDHYRRTGVDIPPDPQSREWGFIPWETGSGTTMIRHRSLAELGNVGEFLSRQQPRHVYYSAGHYGDPGASRMAAKDWRGSDLIFDLDADHLPGVNPETDGYSAMLHRCKDELYSLLDILDVDFGFDQPEIVFSGNRGYHVHIRDEALRDLDRRARRDIVDYVRGEGVSIESVIKTDHVTGAGRSTPAATRRLNTSGGWSRRVHREVLAFVETIDGLDPDEALERLRSIDGVGEHRAAAIREAIADRRHELEDGNVDVHPAFMTVLDDIIERSLERHGAAIDEPVTTDINRLIRLPGSLHGGSGLVVKPLDDESLSSFDPLADAIPDTFRGHEIAVEVTSAVTVEIGQSHRDLAAGMMRLPEFVAVHLMSRGEARKIPESAV